MTGSNHSFIQSVNIFTFKRYDEVNKKNYEEELVKCEELCNHEAHGSFGKEK